MGAALPAASGADEWDAGVLGGSDGPVFSEGAGAEIDAPRWDLSISGGRSFVHKMDARMTTNPIVANLLQDQRQLQLIFNARDVTVDKADDGWAAQMMLSRSIGPWLRFGLQLDSSFLHEQQVESGDIPYIQYDSGGNILSESIVRYEIDYKANLFGASPVLHLGRYFPAGKYALKPYFTAGFGVKHIFERVSLEAADARFGLANRRTTVTSAILGGGMDLRWSSSAAFGLQYQVHRTLSGGLDWSVSQVTLRTAYLF